LPNVLDENLGNGKLQLALDYQRHRSPAERLGGKIVSIYLLPRHTEEKGSRRDLAAVISQTEKLNVKISQGPLDPNRAD